MHKTLKMPRPCCRCCGFTLIEVLVTIVVIGIAAVSMMSVFTSSVRTSADPMLQHQAAAIAEAYMEEIQLKSFAVGPGTGRPNFDDILDYDGLTDVGARDQSNTPIAGLGSYTINVSVTAQALTGSATIPASDSMLIQVVVTHPAINPITLEGFRTNY